MIAYEGVEMYLHYFWNPVWGVSRQLHTLAALLPEKEEAEWSSGLV
jgi:hypothetical protein